MMRSAWNGALCPVAAGVLALGATPRQASRFTSMRLVDQLAGRQ